MSNPTPSLFELDFSFEAFFYLTSIQFAEVYGICVDRVYACVYVKRICEDRSIFETSALTLHLKFVYTM